MSSLDVALMRKMNLKLMNTGVFVSTQRVSFNYRPDLTIANAIRPFIIYKLGADRRTRDVVVRCRSLDEARDKLEAWGLVESGVLESVSKPRSDRDPAGGYGRCNQHNGPHLRRHNCKSFRADLTPPPTVAIKRPR